MTNADTADFACCLIKLDRSVALSRLGGDETLLREVAAVFLEEYPELLAEIAGAVQTQDAGRLQHFAHSLKGAVANFGVQAAYDSALRLEMMGRQGDLSSAGSAFAELQSIMEQLRPSLVALSETA